MLSWITDGFQWILDLFSSILSYAIFLLPDSPFDFIATADTDITKFIRQINWIIPVSSILVFLEVWLSSVLTFYAIKVILRWAKVLK